MTSADWANKDFYKVLGVAKDATAADIKKAYRKLARANHPDSHPGDQAAEDRFKAIAEAYDVVGDAEKRKQYDDLRSGLGGFGPFPTGGPGAGQPFDLNDLFGGGTGRGGGGGFGDVFGGMFGGGGAAPAARHSRAAARTSRPRRRSGSRTRSRASRSRCGSARTRPARTAPAPEPRPARFRGSARTARASACVLRPSAARSR